MPDLPFAYHAALGVALDGLATIGVRLDPRGRQVIDGHLRLLAAWNPAVNLTAIMDPVGLAERHVADSLAAIPVILDGPHRTLIDIGSGAGFPGIPIGAAMPGLRLTLVESTGKKAAFLRVVAAEPGLARRVDVRAERAEAIAPGDWDVVTARAVGALADLVELGLPLLRRGGRLIAWKRGDLAVELAAAGRAAQAMGGSPPWWRPHPDAVQDAAHLAGHGVAVIEKRSPTPEGYPRDPARRKRRPW
ncbi:MAG: 16S rRNA (guanine(527)-N(7))-methyltransferase RsmG [Chloroflexi bacterium]|nr:16S rRNA (guanine(527)-N(7))-methyltransferase RsmG [Chloroflexota bacterium]